MFDEQDYLFENNNISGFNEQEQKHYDSTESILFQDLYNFKQTPLKNFSNSCNDSTATNLSFQVKEEFYPSTQNLENYETSILDFQAKLTPEEYQQLSTAVILTQKIQDKIKIYQHKYSVFYKPLNFPKTLEPYTQNSDQAREQMKQNRRIKVQRYLIKKNKRLQNKNKRSFYTIRTQMAQNRLRVKGRFVKNIQF